jgi:hypothetical protein
MMDLVEMDTESVTSFYTAENEIEDTTMDIDVETWDEPIDPQDSIMILGYYSLGIYWNTYYDSWGRELPIVKYGRTVLCGVLDSEKTQKVEIELRLLPSLVEEDRTPRAVAIMRRVVDYGMNMTHVVQETTTIPALPHHMVDDYECLLFSVSDPRWHEREREPFSIQDEYFTPI